MNILHIDSSALGERSASRALTGEVVQRLRAARPEVRVVHRDLDREPLPHLTAADLSGADPDAAARSAQVLEEFLAADLLVVGAPMYNFTIPSTLKAWIDRIAVAGKTFRYTSAGPEGLAGGKRAILAITQGGVHETGGPDEFQETYLKWVLGFLGITDVEVVRAQGLAMSPEHREQALAAARATMTRSLALAA